MFYSLAARRSAKLSPPSGTADLLNIFGAAMQSRKVCLSISKGQNAAYFEFQTYAVVEYVDSLLVPLWAVASASRIFSFIHGVRT
jgi:hypothetical protein